MYKHYIKKECFAISLATQFLKYIAHLQLTIFIWSLDKLQELQKLQLITTQL
jgi:hypothetical protein